MELSLDWLHIPFIHLYNIDTMTVQSIKSALRKSITWKIQASQLQGVGLFMLSMKHENEKMNLEIDPLSS